MWEGGGLVASTASEVVPALTNTTAAALAEQEAAYSTYEAFNMTSALGAANAGGAGAAALTAIGAGAATAASTAATLASAGVGTAALGTSALMAGVSGYNLLDQQIRAAGGQRVGDAIRNWDPFPHKTRPPVAHHTDAQQNFVLLRSVVAQTSRMPTDSHHLSHHTHMDLQRQRRNTLEEQRRSMYLGVR